MENIIKNQINTSDILQEAKEIQTLLHRMELLSGGNLTKDQQAEHDKLLQQLNEYRDNIIESSDLLAITAFARDIKYVDKTPLVDAILKLGDKVYIQSFITVVKDLKAEDVQRLTEYIMSNGSEHDKLDLNRHVSGENLSENVKEKLASILNGHKVEKKAIEQEAKKAKMEKDQETFEGVLNSNDPALFLREASVLVNKYRMIIHNMAFENGAKEEDKENIENKLKALQEAINKFGDEKSKQEFAKIVSVIKDMLNKSSDDDTPIA